MRCEFSCFWRRMTTKRRFSLKHSPGKWFLSHPGIRLSFGLSMQMTEECLKWRRSYANGILLLLLSFFHWRFPEGDNEESISLWNSSSPFLLYQLKRRRKTIDFLPRNNCKRTNHEILNVHLEWAERAAWGSRRMSLFFIVLLLSSCGSPCPQVLSFDSTIIVNHCWDTLR